MSELIDSAKSVLGAMKRITPETVGGLEQLIKEYEERIRPHLVGLQTFSRHTVDHRTAKSAHEDLIDQARSLCRAVQGRKRDWSDAEAKWRAVLSLDYGEKVFPELEHEATLIATTLPTTVPLLSGHGDGREVPHWDGATLTARGSTKRYKQPALKQREILAAFESAHWCQRISSPLCSPLSKATSKSQVAARKLALRKSADNLTRTMSQNEPPIPIRFHTDGAEAILWTWTPNTTEEATPRLGAS